MKVAEREEIIGEMADGARVALPVIEYQAGKGPAVFVGCSIHGDELTGQPSIWKLREEIERSECKGRLTIVPVMNPMGFNYNVRGVPMGSIDLNRLYPGDAEGSLSERTTAKIWALARQHDYVVDVHTAGWCIPHILVDPWEGDLSQRVWEFASASGITVLHEFESERYALQNLGASLPSVALKEGRVSLTVELGGFKGIDWASVDAGYICLRNLLIKAGLMEGKLRLATSAPVVRETGFRRSSLFAPRGGLLRFEEVPGSKVKEGQVIAEIRDIFGHVSAEVRAPEEGYVVALNAASVVSTGGYVGELAVRRQREG